MLRFQRLRRLTAVATCLLLLQLAFTSGAGMCPLGDGMVMVAPTGNAGASVTGARHQPMHGSETNTPASAIDGHATTTPSPKGYEPASSASHHHSGGHCDMACAPAACGSAGHCSGTASSANATAIGVLDVAHARRLVGTFDAPRSVSTAPEPPPPRA